MFHRIGIAIHGGIDNWSWLEQAIASTGERFRLAYGYHREAAPALRFAYCNTRPTLGHHTEYLWFAQGTAAADAVLPDLAA